MLKWTGALAAAGIVGVGLGLGGDMLLRQATQTTATETATKSVTQTATQPVTQTATVTEGSTQTATQSVTQTSTQSVTQTATRSVTQTATQSVTQTATQTQTATTTVTAPVPTLSYVPPLSPSVQTKVDAQFQALLARHQGDTIVQSGCNQCQYSGPCVLRVHVKNGAVTAIETDNRVSPNVPREDASGSQQDIIHWNYNLRASCPIGRTLHYNNSAPNRMIYPMKNIGTKGPGSNFVRISWNEALNTIATKLAYYKNTYGPYSIISGPWGSGSAMFGLYGVGVGGWAACSNDAGRMFNIFMLGAGESPTPSSNGANMILHSKLIVMMGWTPSSTEKSGSPLALILAKKQGIPIICIDPRYTTDAEVFADQYIPIKPGTDTAFLLGVANYIFKNNLYNQAYVNKFVYGLQQWQDYVLGNAAGPDGKIDRTPEWAAPICGIPADTIKAFATLYANSQPTYLKVHFAAWRKSMGEELCRTAMSLQAIMGYIGVPGGMVGNWNGGMGTVMPSISISYGTAATTYHQTQWFCKNVWPEAINLLDDLNAGKITEAQYKTRIGWRETDVPTKTYPIPNPKMAWGSGGMLTNVCYSMFQAVKALQKLEFFVYSNFFMNSAVPYADIILPQTDPNMEENSVFASSSLMTQFAAVWLGQKVVEPPGECKPTAWVATQLAIILGIGSQYNQYYTTNDVTGSTTPPLKAWDTMVLSRIQAGYATWATAVAAVTPINGAKPAPPSWTDFLAGKVFKMEDSQNDGWYGFSDQIQNGKSFGTNSGKIEILTDFFTQTQGLTTGQAVPNTMLPTYGRYYPAVPSYIPQVRGWYDNLTSQYPLQMLTSHSRYRYHSAFYYNPMLTGEIYQHGLWISGVDAVARGINSGDMLRVFNDWGTIINVKAYVTNRVSPGVVLLRYGTPFKQTAPGIDSGGCANALTGEDDSGSLPVSPVTTSRCSTVVEVQKL